MITPRDMQRAQRQYDAQLPPEDDAPDDTADVTIDYRAADETMRAALPALAKRHGVSAWTSGQSSHGPWAAGETRDGDVLRVRIGHTSGAVVATIDGRAVAP